MEKEIIVVLSNVPWDFSCDYIKQISLALAKETKVVVYYPLKLQTIRQLIFDKKKKGIVFPKNNQILTFISIGFIPFQRFSFVKKLNLKLNGYLFKLQYFINFGLKKPILWGFSYELADILPIFSFGKMFIYDRPDQYSSINKEDDCLIKEKDQKLIKVADFVLVNSPYALRYAKKYNRKSFCVPWGFAADLFSKKSTKIPREIRLIKKPRLGMIGHIDHRLDLLLLYELAKKRKDWNFILVGSIYEFDPKQSQIVGFKENLQKVRELPNVYFLGEKPKSKMVEYISSFDICLILYDTKQEFVKGCNPMKLYEYLAMGKPVISVSIPAVKLASSGVLIGKNAVDFIKQVESLLVTRYNAEKVQLRKKIALENSWEKRIYIIREEVFKNVGKTI